MGLRIGIDLGTTNSLVAIWHEGAARLVPNALGKLLTPSGVSLDKDGALLVGQAALDRQATHPSLTAVSGVLVPGQFSPVIERGTPIPASREQTCNTLQDKQRQLLIEVFQGESRLTTDNVKLGTLELKVPPRPLTAMTPQVAAQQLCALHNRSPPMKQESEPSGASANAGTTLIGTVSSQRGKWLAAASVVAALAGAALVNSAKARRAETETPPAGKFIEVDGVRLHYVDQGKGSSTVVLLHGNGVMLQDYVASGVLDLASREHRVLAFDRPGFGYSERPRTSIWTPTAQAKLILHALEELGVEQAVVVGHSWGTMVAIAMALEDPAAIKGLLLLSGYYYGTVRPDVVPTSIPAIPVIGDLAASTLSPLAGRLMGPAAIKASFAPAPIHQNFARFPLDMTLRPAQIRATAADTAMMIPAAVELSRHYADLAVPVIAMVGKGDLIAHVNRHSQRLVEDLPRGELRIVPGQGHLFHYAVPDQVVTAISDLAH